MTFLALTAQGLGICVTLFAVVRWVWVKRIVPAQDRRDALHRAEQQAEIRAELTVQLKELQPNGGNTVKDAVMETRALLMAHIEAADANFLSLREADKEVERKTVQAAALAATQAEAAAVAAKEAAAAAVTIANLIRNKE